MTQHQGNLGSTERWVSVLSGAGLLLASLRSGSLAGRAFGALAGLSLVGRGAAGHCAMKAALNGETSLRDGLRDQWTRLQSGVAGGLAAGTTPARAIDDMEELYFAEVQELFSAETQFGVLLERIAHTLPVVTLQRTLEGYATEVRTRREDLERILRDNGVDPRAHPDQAMRALLTETGKMAQVGASNVRAAALIASIQRVLHYKIAGYGTVATYAQTLGRAEEASRFAEHADRDKAVDRELTEVAKELVNPRAQAQPDPASAETLAARPH